MEQSLFEQKRKSKKTHDEGDEVEQLMDHPVTQMSVFAQGTMDRTYAHAVQDEDRKETWAEIADRVTKNVMRAVGVDMRQRLAQEIRRLITERKFIPGGRYLYASGNQYHQVNNCYGAETRIVTADGCKPISELVGLIPTLMTTGGTWMPAEVVCFGEQQLYKVTFSFGRLQKVLYATAHHSWRVVGKVQNRRFALKQCVDTVDLVKGDTLWQVYGYGMSRTPISPTGIQHGLVYGDGTLEGKQHASKIRLCGEKNAELLPYFPLYPTLQVEEDTVVTHLPRHYKQKPSLQWDRSYLLGWLVGYFAADGCVSQDGVITLPSTDYESLAFVKDIAYVLGIGVNAIHFSDRVSNLTQKDSRLYCVSFNQDTLTEDFFLLSEHKRRFQDTPLQRRTCWKVQSVEPTDRIEPVYCAVVPETHEFVLEDNILTGNCLLLKVHDSREGWSELLYKASMALMSGAGIGVDYSDIRHEGAPIRKTGGVATGPLSLMQILNECGRGIMQGGNRRSAIWAGLRWDHPDVHRLIRIKNWPSEIHMLKAKDHSFPAILDCTNISVQLNEEFFEAYEDDEHPHHSLAHSVYWATVEQMLKTGEPGFTVDVGKNTNETLRNACGELASRDTDDICNLGSLNLARIESLNEFKNIMDVAIAFLLAGTVYSDVPYSDVDKVRSKNRRLGLGLMGIHEWLLKRGRSYAPDEELGTWLAAYAKSGRYANKWADEWELSRPKKTRAIAPNGTTSIVAETTGGIEPVFCVAYKRRYLKGEQRYHQYVIDPCARRLIESGVDPNKIEDAYMLARDVERRVAFQAWVQQYVDHCISSTINLPAYGSEWNNQHTVRPFGSMLMRHLPQLRGITCYPDGSRSGQPLTPVPYEEALAHEGAELLEESVNVCNLRGGSCGD